MGKIDDYVSKLSSVSEDTLDASLLAIVDRNKSSALDMNISQLFAGRDSKDGNLVQYRSDSYAKFKNNLNPKPGFGNPDLKLTGEFYQGFFADTSKFPVIFSSNDSKTEKLLSQYGEDIFGLDQSNLEEFRQEIKPQVQEAFRSFLQL